MMPLKALLLVVVCVAAIGYANAVYSTSQLRTLWAPACNPSDYVTVTLPSPTGAKVTVQARAASFFRRMHDIMYLWNWDPPAASTGAYNCRQITGGTGYSLHAYGIAGDYDWNRNPYGSTLVTNMPQGMVDEILAIRTGDGLEVFRWGGYYSGSKDAMHYEVIASPAQLAAGISPNTCSLSSGAGQCVHSSRCGVTGTGGLCPGAASVICCPSGSVTSKRSGGTGTGTGTTGPTYGSCVASGVTGVCKSETSCNGIVTAGLCPGAASIKCCTEPSCTAGSNGAGLCIKTSACQVGFSFSGYCPGDSTIRCCTRASSAAEMELPSFIVDEPFNSTYYNASAPLGDDDIDHDDQPSANTGAAVITVSFGIVVAMAFIVSTLF